MGITTVNEYIESAPKETQEKLKKLREIILTTLPEDTKESVSYMMPFYSYKGRVCYFGVFKNHIGFFVMPPIIAKHKEDLKNYVTTISSVHLPLDQDLPEALIKKLLAARVKFNEEKSN